VHYIPVHLHPFYKETFATCEGLCPVAEEAYKRILSLPIYPGLEESDVDFVTDTLYSIIG
jgi:perosamine synthetase